MGVPLAGTRQSPPPWRGTAENAREARSARCQLSRRAEPALRYPRPDLEKDRGNAGSAEPAVSPGVVAFPRHRSPGGDAIAEALYRGGHAALCGSARRTAGGGIAWASSSERRQPSRKRPLSKAGGAPKDLA